MKPTLQAVRSAIDGEIETLLGHSRGGAVALCGGRTTRANRVIAIDPSLGVDPHFDAGFREPIAKSKSGAGMANSDGRRKTSMRNGMRFAPCAWSRFSV